ncbi:response regulator [Paenibacillus andongensis]|uniref:response regulator n=1 Tax=Paenibacillus andongensis TaxID=2975482 RepID=UPI0021BAF049|nr:response regulator [Paenibacillus andongensis]
MRVLLVDDEPLALRNMEKLLGNHEDIEVVSALVDPREALIMAQQEQVDAIFLDLEMPEIGGMELAEQLYTLLPDVRIVFVTAFHQYAVEAFELNALDYLLKPVFAGRLNKTLDRLRKIIVPGHSHKIIMNAVQICCFQSLHWINGDEGIRSFSWRTSKTQELFTFLLHQRRGPVVRKEFLMELLWPDLDPNRAAVLLHTTVYQIRKMLKDLGLTIQVIYEKEGYRLELDNILVDVDGWEQELQQAPEMNLSTVGTYKNLLAIYKGDYLAELEFQWAEAERERLRLIRWKYLRRFANFCLDQGLLTEAGDMFQQMRDHYPLVEDGYFGLMRVHLMLSNFAEIKQQFEMLRNRLDEELAISPSSSITQWFNETFKTNN